MEDLKLEEDEATPGAAQGPSPFAAGPLPRTLFFRETGVTPWRARGKRVVVTSPPPRPPNRGGGRFQDEVVEEVDSDEEQGLLECNLHVESGLLSIQRDKARSDRAVNFSRAE